MADFQTIAEKKGIKLNSEEGKNKIEEWGQQEILLLLYWCVPLQDLTKKMKLAFFGDGQNNVTYELMRMCALYGFDIHKSPSRPHHSSQKPSLFWQYKYMDIACPNSAGFVPEQSVIDAVNEVAVLTGSTIRVVHDVMEAARNSDIVSS